MKIILNNGIGIENTTVGKVMNRLELTMSKADAVANIGNFMNPEVMSRIEYYFGAWKIVYTGFSRMSHMENPKENEMRVWMTADGDFAVSDRIPLFDEMYIPKGV